MAKPKQVKATPIHHGKSGYWKGKQSVRVDRGPGDYRPSYVPPSYGGGDLPKMTTTKPKTPRGAGTAKAVTALSKGTMAKKAAGWLKRQGFVPTIR